MSSDTAASAQAQLTPADVTIVIPTWNRADLLADCLASLRSHILCKVLVVDNGSVDDTRGVCSDVAYLHLESNIGFGPACNIGAREADTPYICFLNNDTISENDWLSPMISHAGEGIVGARLLDGAGQLVHTGIVFKRNRWGRLTALNDRSATRASGYCAAVTGACLLMRRSLFIDELGGFDDTFVNGYEDVDLCLRARANGYRVWYEQSSVLVHLESQTSGRFDHMEANRIALQRRWGSGTDAVLVDGRMPGDSRLVSRLHSRYPIAFSYLLRARHSLAQATWERSLKS